MLAKEGIGFLQQSQTVLYGTELMIGVGNGDEPVRLTGTRQRLVHLLGLLEVYLCVHFTLEDQQRNLEVSRMQARRIAFQLVGIGSDLPLDGIRAQPMVPLFDQQRQVARSRDVDRAAKEVGISLRTEEGKIAAEAPTGDADALWIRDALLDGPARAVDHVIVSQSAPILVRGEEPVIPVSARAAKIHLQYGVAPADQKLAQKEITPGITCNRPSMRHHDQR